MEKAAYILFLIFLDCICCIDVSIFIFIFHVNTIRKGVLF